MHVGRQETHVSLYKSLYFLSTRFEKLHNYRNMQKRKCFIKVAVFTSVFGMWGKSLKLLMYVEQAIQLLPTTPDLSKSG